jgi:tetratricopeptide (TPR) repeat protein
MQVLGKPADFNPRLDASVRIHANRLRKLLKVYNETNSPVKDYRIILPTGHYRPEFIKGNETNRGEIAINKKNKLIQQHEVFVSVVPFTGLVKDWAGEEIVEMPCVLLYEKLSLFQDISMVPKEQVFKYFKKGGTANDIGKRLGVTYYLSGNIDIEGDFIRVIVSLFKALNNEFVISLSYEERKDKNSIREAIDKITSKISSAIGDYSGLVHLQNFTLAEIVPISSIISHAAFWHYKHLTNNRKEIFTEALAQMQAAVKEHPRSALSWAVLGNLLIDGISYNFLPLQPALDQAFFAAGKALEENPDCQHGHITMGWVMIFYREVERAIYHFKRAIVINPYSTYFKTAASLGLALAGEYESSIFHLEAAIKLNTIPGWWVTLPFVFVYLKEEDYDKMLFYSRNVSTPSVVFEHVFEMIALYYLNKKSEILKLLKTYNKNHPGGLKFVMEILPLVLQDHDLITRVVTALHQIRHWEETQFSRFGEIAV